MTTILNERLDTGDVNRERMGIARDDLGMGPIPDEAMDEAESIVRGTLLLHPLGYVRSPTLIVFCCSILGE